MNLRRLLAMSAFALSSLATQASAHRLDEYLQATTIAVGRGQVTLRLSLTPGVSVAAEVLARIDTDGDGAISPAEQRRYAQHVTDDLRVTIDGSPATPDLRSWAFATPASLRGGAGDITLVLVAPIGPGDAHRIALDHPHPDGQAVYLVNALVPADRGIHVAAQQRSYDQSHYQLDIAIAPAVPAGRQPGQTEDRSPDRNAAPVLATFFGQGVRHILTGYDHLLFVAALVLGAATLWDLVKVVTAFTVAHSITLSLAALRLVHVPETLVEPVIAASIVAVAIQNVARPDQARTASRLALAFLFGLFHGLGFAGGLLQLMHAMSGRLLLSAIAGFSLGVETGNQLVLLPLFAALRALDQRAGSARSAPIQRIRQLASIVIAGAGAAYFATAIAAAI